MKRKPDYHSLLGKDNPLDHFPLLYGAAMAEFSKKRFEDASLNDILRKAQMSKGSLYHHFGDKFGLYLAVIDIIGQRKIEFFTPLMLKGLEGGHFFEMVKTLARETMAFMFQDERMYHLFNRIMEEGRDFLSKLLPYFRYDFGQGFGVLIDAAFASGEIDIRYPRDFVKRTLDLLFSTLHKLTASRDPEEMYHYLTLSVDMMRSGLSGQKEQKA